MSPQLGPSRARAGGRVFLISVLTAETWRARARTPATRSASPACPPWPGPGLSPAPECTALSLHFPCLDPCLFRTSRAEAQQRLCLSGQPSPALPFSPPGHTTPTSGFPSDQRAHKTGLEAVEEAGA